MPDFSRLDAVKRQRPLIHCVSNLVSANDCANLALAIGASPMMAQALPEMEDITTASSATPHRSASWRTCSRPTVLPISAPAKTWTNRRSFRGI